jgi:hypothetical protein
MGCPGDDAGIADVRDHRVDGPPLHRRAGALDDEDVGIEHCGGERYLAGCHSSRQRGPRHSMDGDVLAAKIFRRFGFGFGVYYDADEYPLLAINTVPIVQPFNRFAPFKPLRLLHPVRPLKASLL